MCPIWFEIERESYKMRVIRLMGQYVWYDIPALSDCCHQFVVCSSDIINWWCIQYEKKIGNYVNKYIFKLISDKIFWKTGYILTSYIYLLYNLYFRRWGFRSSDISHTCRWLYWRGLHSTRRFIHPRRTFKWQ